MAGNYVLPVKLFLNTLDTGIKLSDDLLESASSATSTASLQISAAAPLLKRSLERGAQSVRDAYSRNLRICGEPFSEALARDSGTKDRLNRLKNDLKHAIHEVDEDPDCFDPAAFLNIQEKANERCAECIHILDSLADQLRQTRLSVRDELQDNRHSLSSALSLGLAWASTQQPIVASPSAQLQGTLTPTLAFVTTSSRASNPQPATPPQSPWAIHRAAEFNVGFSAGTTEPSRRRNVSREISPSSIPEGATPRLISKDVVDYRISANEEWLNRRKESRLSFQKELKDRTTSQSSFTSIGEYRVSEAFSDSSPTASPIHRHSGPLVSSIDGRTSRTSLNGYDTRMMSERSHRVQSQHSTRHSGASSILQEQQLRQQRPQVQRQESQESIFGLREAPLSPPLSSHRASAGNDPWTSLAPTLKLPGYGDGVEPGLEPLYATQSQFEDGLIAVVGGEEVTYNDQPATPRPSSNLSEFPIRADASFYKMKGFCEGAQIMIRGENGFRVVKRPSGQFNATISAKCIKCAYEVGWYDVEKDKLLDRAGIYGNSGIRWRQRFISKCHIRADSIDASAYACVFCIEERKTVDDHDATVFFSVVQLFRHLATHSLPLPIIAGITVLYGPQPATVLDFDVHFTTTDAAPHTFCMRKIAQKVATRPAAKAVQTFNPKPTQSMARDPNGGPVLHFAIGARIVGITFPREFHGKWCMGYHDGERGAFPISHITVERPDGRDCFMDNRSSLVADVIWDFKPTATGPGSDWLQLRKGDRITCIGYTYHDNWCWSGQNSKGQFGLFPRAFLGPCREEVTSPTRLSTSGPKQGGSILGKVFGRHKSVKEERPVLLGRSGSVASGGSSVSGHRLAKGQPGLEVVGSPVQGHIT